MKGKVSKELEHFKQTLKYLKKDYGTKLCKTFHPACANCNAQWMIGWVDDHISLLEWEIREDSPLVKLRK